MAGREGRPPRLMIVDDEAVIVKLITVVASALLPGVQIRSCDNGDDAIPLALSFAPDLLLLDLKMPGRGGFEVIAELRAHAATAATPVVVMTGLDTWDTLRKVDAQSRVTLMAKPLDVSDLRQLLLAHLGP